MSLSTTGLNRLKNGSGSHTIEHNSGLLVRCGAANTNQSHRIIGKTRLPHKGKQYPIYDVSLGIWGKDFTDKEQIINEWNKRKEWALENNCDIREYGKKRIADKTETFKEICDQYLKENPRNLKETSLRTTRDRLNQITKLLPEGILINQFEGEKGRKLILKYVIEPKINAENPSKYQAKRFRGVLKQIFNYALRYCKIKESEVPNLYLPFPFEDGITEKRRPHLQWNEFKEEFITALNENKCDGGTLTECSVKASLLMLSRVSSIVRLQWDWIKNVDPDSGEIHPVNAKNKKYISCFVIPPETKGLKRQKKKIDEGNAEPHYIPITTEMKKLLQKIKKITGNQKNVFWSPNAKGFINEETPNDHLRNLGFKARQCIHGFRHVATTSARNIGGLNIQMVSKTIGHLDQTGSISNYDLSLCIKERKEVLEWWNQELVNQGLEI